MEWEIESSASFDAWFETLDRDAQWRIVAAQRILASDGPTLGRPLVDRIAMSRHQHMKELRPLGSSLRILFAFDPDRKAILLIGGDKEGEWNTWYDKQVPIADDLFDAHLAQLRERERQVRDATKVSRDRRSPRKQPRGSRTDR